MSPRAPSQPAPRFARWLLPALAVGAVVFVGWLWRLCYHDPQIRFLAPHGPAEWIVFPKPANFDGRPEVELFVHFSRRWTLNAVPARAALTYRAFTHAVVTVNGITLPARDGAEDRDWKSPFTIDVTRHLRTGTNEIVILVGNSSGPPALWAWLDAGARSLVTDEHWDATFTGSAWRPAQRASEPLAVARDGSSRDFSDAMPAWQTRWPTLLVLAGIAALALAAWPPWRRFAAQNKMTAPRAWLQDPARMMLLGVSAAWLVLFWHNRDLLPIETGYDAPAHGDYIRYIMDRHALPLANEGGTMYNPPLYYAICAGLLEMFSTRLGDPAAAEILRGFALVTGMVHLLLIAGCLRLIFPEQARAQAVGLLLAAALPPHLYISHYLTNEWLVAFWVTATIYLCLRLLRAERATGRACAGIGACLGAALLTKFTSLLVVPFVIAVVALKVRRQPNREKFAWLKTTGVLGIVCLAVCGWHYLRVWQHFGKPFVASWEAESGFRWWQDQGYLTFSGFLRFGDALAHPAFSARNGIWDGLYSTWWADGLCGGRATGDFRPPWDYALMAVGGVLALLPCVAILAGAVASLGRFLRQPTPERLILNGLGFGFAAAFVALNLKVPYYGELKAFYGLVALVPACVFGAEILEAAARNRPRTAAILGGVLGTWALLSFATYWIPSEGAQTHLLLGDACKNSQQVERAVTHYNAALKAEPRNALARSQLASALMELGRASEAREQIQRNLADHPDAAICHLQSALVALGESQPALALEHTRRALELAPDCAPAHALFVRQLQPGPELVAAGRESLRIDPGNPETHLALGMALAARAGMAEEAREHLRIAGRLAPASVSLLNNVAWALATHPNEQVRDGPLAVQLAGKACALSGYKSVTPLITLAAAQAETGLYEEAAKSAVLGQQLAVASGQSQLAAQCASLASWFHSGRPYRQR